MTTKPLYGCQEPRIDIYRAGDTTKAGLFFEFLDAYSAIKLLEWQRTVLRRWLAEDKDGNFANIECGLSVPRQNGKSEIVAARILYGIIFRRAVGLFTAQQQNTADVIKRRVQDFFYDAPHEEIFNLLAPRFRKKPRNYDFIEFENGARYSFTTRTRLGGLGTTNDEIICDEAGDMLDAHQATLLPTMTSVKSGNPQIIYVGTPPTAESVGAVFGRVRRGKLEGAPGCWTEWSVENIFDPHEKKIWYQTNPSLGYFMLPAAVEVEANSLDTDSFNRQRLGWWAGNSEEQLIRDEVWGKCYTDAPDFDDDFAPVYAVKFAPDRSTYSLAAAQQLKNKKIHVEVILHGEMKRGLHPVTRWILERWRDCAAIVVDGVTGAPILLEELTSAGVPPKKITQPNMRDIVAAHQFTLDAILRGELSHFDQPLLNQCARLAKQRPLGRWGGFGWASRNDQISTAPLDAATFAFWAAKTKPKKRKTVEEKKNNAELWEKVLQSL